MIIMKWNKIMSALKIKNANGQINKNIIISGSAVLVVIIGLCIFFSLPKHLTGEYSHTTNLILVSSTDTLKFDGDKVIEYSDGEKTHSGTYTISGNELKMTIDSYNMTAKLSDDKQSFVVESADGLATLTEGFKYTKSDKK